jgi:2'-5' RNA ligase
VRDHWWWRPGWRLGRRAYTFHITFEDGMVEGGSDLRRLAATYQASLAGMPGLDLVPLQWLHLTMQNVGFTDEVGEDEVRVVADAAAARFAELAPFDLTFGPVEVRREAIAFRPTPAEPVSRLREAARSAIAAVRGPDGVPEAPEHAHGFEPHVSMAYSNADGPVDPLVRAVASVSAPTATVRVLAASLIVLDRDERVYRWSRYRTLALG